MKEPNEQTIVETYLLSNYFNTKNPQTQPKTSTDSIHSKIKLIQQTKISMRVLGNNPGLEHKM